MVKYLSFSVTLDPCCFTLVLFLNSFGFCTLLTNYSKCISLTNLLRDVRSSQSFFFPASSINSRANTSCITIILLLATRQFTICCLNAKFQRISTLVVVKRLVFFSTSLTVVSLVRFFKFKQYIDIFPLGNLALSRALGDFCFKKNVQKSAEEQIVTGYLFYCI